MRARASILAACLTLGATTACSSTVAGHGTTGAATGLTRFPGSATPRPTATRAASAWIQVQDSTTNFRFELPGTPHLREDPDTRTGSTDIQRRMYSATASGGVLSVTIVNTDDGSELSDDLDAIATGLVREFAQAGTADAQVLEKRRRQLRGRPALSFRVRFTPSGAGKGPVVWLAWVIYAGPAVVIAQAITFPQPGAAAQQRALAQYRPLETRLVDSIRLG